MQRSGKTLGVCCLTQTMVKDHQVFLSFAVLKVPEKVMNIGIITLRCDTQGVL